MNLTSGGGLEPFEKVSYETEKRQLKKVLRECGVFSKAVTHIFRKVCARVLGEKGVQEREVAMLGVWDLVDVLKKVYMKSYAYTGIKVAAGMDETDPKVPYVNPR